eukprot:11172174-Lingulodinium_polyedra.AAC.1
MRVALKHAVRLKRSCTQSLVPARKSLISFVLDDPHPEEVGLSTPPFLWPFPEDLPAFVTPPPAPSTRAPARDAEAEPELGVARA